MFTNVLFGVLHASSCFYDLYIFLHALSWSVCHDLCVCFAHQCMFLDNLQMCIKLKAVGLCPATGSFEARWSPAPV